MPDPPSSISLPEWRPIGGFVMVILTVYGVSVIVGWAQSGTPVLAHGVLEPFVYPILYYYAPPLLAFYNHFPGGTIQGSLLIGTAPGVTFPVLLGLV